jgi:hypothetical protein
MFHYCHMQFPNLGSLQDALPNGPLSVPASAAPALSHQWSMGSQPASYPPNGPAGTTVNLVTTDPQFSVIYVKFIYLCLFLHLLFAVSVHKTHCIVLLFECKNSLYPVD